MHILYRGQMFSWNLVQQLPSIYTETFVIFQEVLEIYSTAVGVVIADVVHCVFVIIYPNHLLGNLVYCIWRSYYIYVAIYYFHHPIVMNNFLLSSIILCHYWILTWNVLCFDMGLLIKDLGFYNKRQLYLFLWY